MLNIVEIKKKIGNGCTIPYVVWCDDGNTYIVKFPGNLQGTKALVNEYIASCLARYLELPILEYKLIRVKKQDYRIEMDPDIELVEGTAFGTIYNPDITPVLNPGMIIISSNRYVAVKILIFDLLMGNYDRNEGNLLISLKTKEIVMIDHSHIFGLGTIWDKHQLPRLINEPFDLKLLNDFNYRNIVESFKFDRYFYIELNKFINKVKNIRKDYIHDIMNQIPNDWDITEEEKQLLVEYIYLRFRRVEEILSLLNIKGGDVYED